MVATIAESSTVGDPTRTPLLSLARRSLVDAVDVLSKALLASQTDSSLEEPELVAFIVGAQSYAQRNVHPEWLGEIANDGQLLDRLLDEVQGESSEGNVEFVALGIQDSLRDKLIGAADTIRGAVAGAEKWVLDRGGDFVSTRLVAWGRRPLNGVLGRFLGDIFTYLSTRGEPGAMGDILDTISEQIDAARTPGEPLIIVGHSLGGVIAFDLLSYYRTDVEVDLLVTVGSQVAHFAEIKRLKISTNSDGAPKKLAVPTNIKRWINIFDPIDILAYAAADVFDRVEDYGYDTRTHTIDAHSAYFVQSRFFERLMQRIAHQP
jgi:hypothetical protein